MAQSKESTGKNRFWHWVRVAVSLLSFGFIFPHALTEDTDNTMFNAGKDAQVKKE